MTDVATRIVRQRGRIALGFIAAALLLLPFATQISQRLAVGGAGVEHSEAARVDHLLATRFAAPFASSLVLTVSHTPPLDEVEGYEVLENLITKIEGLENVTDVLSYLNTSDPAFRDDTGTFVVVGLAADGSRVDTLVVALRKATQAWQRQLRADYPRAELAWTGAAAFDYDVRLTSATDAARAERRVLPVTLILLFLVFGSLVAALCPLSIGALAVGLSLGAAALLTPFWSLTVLLQNIVTMIGLGIGIDYTLLMVSRFREELAASGDPEQAAIETLRTAGHTVLQSGGAVAIGFAALLLVPAAELRSIATGGLLVVSFSLLLATLLLPGVLLWLGPRVEWGRAWSPRSAQTPSPRWLAWGRVVARYPLVVLIVVGLPLAALAWQARLISTDIPSGSWLPEQMESTRGAQALQRMGQSGLLQTVRVLVQMPDAVTVDSQPGWSALHTLSQRLANDPPIARVNSLPLLVGADSIEIADAMTIAPELRSSYQSIDRNMALIELIPRETASAGALMRYVRELRATNLGDSLAGMRVLVGGLPAHNTDYQDAIGGSVVAMMLFVVIASFAALLLGFRSLLGALKAVALNLFSVAAAMGATVLVFQHGVGAHWLGVAQPLDGLFPAVPIIVFCVVYGLSMDYEVFLFSRVAEGVRNGLSNHDALVVGLARTGGVITSAALVMIVVFIGFSLGDFLIMKILGFALAVAVLIDATLVRLAIGPALLQLGGRWNWWPGRRGAARDD